MVGLKHQQQQKIKLFTMSNLLEFLKLKKLLNVVEHCKNVTIPVIALDGWKGEKVVLWFACSKPKYDITFQFNFKHFDQKMFELLNFFQLRSFFL